MKKTILISLVGCAFLLIQTNGSSQGLLKRLKDKATNVADKVVDKKIAEKTGTDASSNSTNNSNTTTGSGRGRASNKTGEGLKNSTIPDVNQQIQDAEKAHDAGNYSDARYSTQQALMGVELQIGKEILKLLPETVSGLPKDTLEDRVVSTQWGWANMTIQRLYKKDDKELTIVIGNNPLYSGLTDLYFGGAYSTQSGGENQNIKQIKVKDNRAVIKYDASEGYSLIVKLGQAGIISWQGVNFATEQDMMNAVNNFDIDGIKKMLGEQ